MKKISEWYHKTKFSYSLVKFYFFSLEVISSYFSKHFFNHQIILYSHFCETSSGIVANFLLSNQQTENNDNEEMILSVEIRKSLTVPYQVIMVLVDPYSLNVKKLMNNNCTNCKEEQFHCAILYFHIFLSLLCFLSTFQVVFDKLLYSSGTKY